MRHKGTVLLGGFAHESNTFTPLPMMADEFWMHQGDFSPLETEDSEYAGALRELRKLSYSARPMIATGATVGGVIERRLLERYMARLSALLDQIGPDENIVGIQWVLHGSSMVDGVKDVQTEILRTLRARFPALPIVVSMDLHSTVTASLLELVDGLTHYQTAPHVDMQETGARASRMLDQLIATYQATERLAIKIPLLLPGEFGQTGLPVVTEIYHHIETFREFSGALDVSLSQGFPWADNPEGTVTLVGIWPQGLLTEAVWKGMQDLAQHIWNGRRRIYQTLTLHKVSDIGTTSTTGVRYTVFCDSGDNPTAGAPEDRIGVLADVLQRGIKDVLFVPIVDAPFVRACTEVPAGQTVTGTLGGKLSGSPSVTVRAQLLRSGRNGRMGAWIVGNINGNVVLVTERRFGVSSPQLLADCGFDLEALPSTIVVKSGYLFEPWKRFFASHKGQEFLLDTTGFTTLALETLPYRTMSDSVFPLTTSPSRAYTIALHTIGRSRASRTTSPLND